VRTDDVSAVQTQVASGAEGDLTHTTAGLQRRLVRIGPYSITVLVADDGQFIGIEGVGIEKSFLNLSQRMSLAKGHDVEKYFEE